MLSVEDEGFSVAFRKHTLLPLDCLYALQATIPALQATIPHLTRSSLHRCYQRRGISRTAGKEGVPDLSECRGSRVLCKQEHGAWL